MTQNAGGTNVSSGIEPIPILYETMPDGALKEAFRQGWEAARHWPNHPLPQHLFVRSEELLVSNRLLIRIEWP
jgi:hypothetical protein